MTVGIDGGKMDATETKFMSAKFSKASIYQGNEWKNLKKLA